METFEIVGSLVKSRAKGSHHANVGSFAIIHGTSGETVINRYVKNSGELGKMLARYAKKGANVTVEYLKHGAHQAEHLGVSQPAVIGDAQTPLVIEAPKPEFQVLRDRALAYDKPSKKNQVGRKLKNSETHKLVAKLEKISDTSVDLEYRMARLSSKIAKDQQEGKDITAESALLLKIRDANNATINLHRKLAAELSHMPRAWQVAQERSILKQLKALRDMDTPESMERVVGTGPDGEPILHGSYLRSGHAAWLRKRLQRVRGLWMNVEVPGAGTVKQGDIPRSGLPEIQGIDHNSMTYLLTLGQWGKTNTINGVEENDLPKNAVNKLVDEYEDVIRNIIFGKVFGSKKTSGFFEHFPELKKDEEFKDALPVIAKITLIQAARKYTPDVALKKFEQGTTFRSHIIRTIEGTILNQFKNQADLVLQDRKGDSLDQPIYLNDDKIAPRELLATSTDRRYASPEEVAILHDAERIISEKISPQSALVFFSRLNFYNPQNKLDGAGGLKGWDQVAADLKEKFGGVQSVWESKAEGIWNHTQRLLTDARTSSEKFTKEDREGIYAGLKVAADVLAHKKEMSGEDQLWRKPSKQAKRSVNEPKFATVLRKLHPVKDERVLDRMKRLQEGTGHFVTEAWSNKPEVTFWNQPQNAALAQMLAVAPIEGAPVHETNNAISNFHSMPGVSPHTRLREQYNRMKKLFTAHTELSKLDRKTLKHGLGPAVDHLTEMFNQYDAARQYQQDSITYDVMKKDWVARGARLKSKEAIKRHEAKKPKAPVRPVSKIPLKDILSLRVKVGEATIRGISPRELSAIGEYVAQKKVTKKSLSGDDHGHLEAIRLYILVEQAEARHA